MDKFTIVWKVDEWDDKKEELYYAEKGEYRKSRGLIIVESLLQDRFIIRPASSRGESRSCFIEIPYDSINMIIKDLKHLRDKHGILEKE